MSASDNDSCDNSAALVEQVKLAVEQQTPLTIVGGNSKAMLGQRPLHAEGSAAASAATSAAATELSTRSHQGIINYDPTELVVSVRAGTRMTDLVAVLDEAGQMLPFDPPQIEGSTIGGVLACGLSGPRRPFNGSARDYVLGARVINGQAQDLSFGGQVMKNVAGYDVSRLQVGAWGTLGVLLDVSMKVLPKPEMELTLQMSCEAHDLQAFAPLMRKPLPLSGAMQIGDARYLRLSGSEAAVQSAAAELGGEVLPDNSIWASVRDHDHPFFGTAYKNSAKDKTEKGLEEKHLNNADAQQSQTLWRISVADYAPELALSGEYLYEWAGAQRWLLTSQPSTDIFKVVQAAGGHATRYSLSHTPSQPDEPAFQPLSGGMQRLQKRVRDSFDPQRLFNRGRFHPELDVMSPSAGATIDNLTSEASTT